MKHQDFAATRWSQVVTARGADPAARAALAWLCERYWQPLFQHVRAKGWGPHSASDLTQDFFIHIIERDLMTRADADRGRFRSFLLGCLDRFLAHHRRAECAEKRGGTLKHVAADTMDLIAHDRSDAEASFDAQWASHLCWLAWHKLADEHRDQRARFDALATCVTTPASNETYRRIAATWQMSEVAVKVAVHRLRQRYRELLESEIRQTLASPSPQAVQDEFAALAAATTLLPAMLAVPPHETR